MTSINREDFLEYTKVWKVDWQDINLRSLKRQEPKKVDNIPWINAPKLNWNTQVL